ncbi:hypothetical protein TraAM80_04280 [Trypanosoma rangeli]|uniref:Armadillo repeat-containing protein 1 n=1 Tax=Trypanosoma rangeli TaxID=5698 RepID=A0A3R7RKF3_TRYRA|nr:uncharacterized protein TraAM80_04280 [Trypanosoma rangeli]RNF05944.1 hypothetical protein TraAM80_04280 [Trypanosoma rangeli]|eukprot:RNF05944.1 hypothetical protein TraAM80_04280 [Trypanosoma rangeli]
MASLNTELALVKRFHALSKNYDNRPVVARRSTLPALVRFLGSKDRETRKYSLAALHLLAEHPENVELLAEEDGLVQKVFRVHKDAEYDDPELYELTNQLLDLLEPVLLGQDPRKKEVPEEKSMGCSGSNNCMEDNTVDTSFSLARRKRAARVLHGVGSDAIHTVILDIPALDPRNGDDLATIEDIFQSTRGVLSYSIFLEQGQAQLFMTCETRAVQQSLLDAGFESVVVRDDIVNRGIFGGDEGDRTSNNRSYYDGETPPKRPSYLESFTNTLYETALVLRGGGSQDDSLSSRVRRQQDREQRGTSTLGYVANALSKWW